MNFETKEFTVSEIVVINLPARVAAETSEELKKFIKELVERKNYKLVMNLSQTSFMDSSGLGALVSKIAVTRSNQGDVRLANPREYIRNLLELTHLDQIIKIYPSVKEAVNSFEVKS